MYINDCQGKEFKLEYRLQLQQGPKTFFNSPGASHQIFQNVNHVPYLLITDNNKKLIWKCQNYQGCSRKRITIAANLSGATRSFEELLGKIQMMIKAEKVKTFFPPESFSFVNDSDRF